MSTEKLEDSEPTFEMEKSDSQKEQSQEFLKGRDLLNIVQAELKFRSGDKINLKCKACGKTFSRAQYLKTHILTIHQGQKRYKCDTCGKLFASERHVKKHINIIHEGHKEQKNHKCESCGKSFSFPGGLKSHILTVHEGRKDYKCDFCSKAFSDAQYLKQHIYIIHGGNKDYKCNFCGKPFGHNGGLKFHIARHHLPQDNNVQITHDGSKVTFIEENNGKYYKCPLCEEKFPKAFSTANMKAKLKAHLRNNHGNEYKCDTCGKLFTYPKFLKNHIKEFHAKRTCKFCDKKFKIRQELKKHIQKWHSNDGSKDWYKCDSCGLLYSEKEKLEKHIKKICGRKYKCQSCKRTFNSERYLKKHVKIKHDDDNNDEVHEDSKLKNLDEDNGKMKFKCNSCDKSFTFSKRLKNHIKLFHSDFINEDYGKNKCDFCEKSFFAASSLKAHLTTEHGVDHTCKFCKKTFKHPKYFKNHMEKFHKNDSNRYQCDLCTTNNSSDPIKLHNGFKSKLGLRIHIETVHEGKKQVKCNTCNKTLTNQAALNNHIHVVHKGRKDHHCESCGKSFGIKHQLRKHIHLVHEGRRDHKCESCGKDFATGMQVRRHIRVWHDGIKDYPCNQCETKLTTQMSLNHHIKVIHEGKKEYKCKYCKKDFGTHQELKIHVYAKHEKKYDFDCKSCGKSFVQKCQLNRHIRIVHEGRKDFHCDSCKKVFTTNSTLRKHIHRTHEGREKSHKCDSCDTSFYEENNLKKHKLSVHEGRKDYHCEICSKNFSSSGSLRIHIKNVHGGEKSHQCKFCAKKYSTSFPLKLHFEKSHKGIDDVEYQCEFCKRFFCTERSLKKHLMLAHEYSADAKDEELNIEKNINSVHEGIKNETNEEEKNILSVHDSNSSKVFQSIMEEMTLIHEGTKDESNEENINTMHSDHEGSKDETISMFSMVDNTMHEDKMHLVHEGDKVKHNVVHDETYTENITSVDEGNIKNESNTKPIPKIIDLNIENNFKRAEVTDFLISDAIAKIERKENYQEPIEGLKVLEIVDNAKSDDNNIDSLHAVEKEKSNVVHSETYRENKTSVHEGIKDKSYNENGMDSVYHKGKKDETIKMASIVNNATCKENIQSVHEGGKEVFNVVHQLLLPQGNVQNIVHEGSKIMFNEESGKYYKCPLCEDKLLKAFSKANTMAKLEAHLRNTHGNKYKCDTSTLEIVKNTTVENDISNPVHEGGKEKYTDVNQLLLPPQGNAQIKIHEGSKIMFSEENGKYYKCPLCEQNILKAFSKANTMAKLEAHLRNNHGNKYKFDISNLEIVKNAVIENNFSNPVHEGGKEKSKVNHQLLPPQSNGQIIIHDGSKIIFNEENSNYYKCPLCENNILKAFSKANTKAKLEAHLRNNHEGTKNKHNLPAQLNVQIIHDGSKITFKEENGKYYKCPLCDEKFLKAFSKANTKAKLEAHLRNNHSSKRYKNKENMHLVHEGSKNDETTNTFSIVEVVDNAINEGGNVNSVHGGTKEKSNAVHNEIYKENMSSVHGGHKDTISNVEYSTKNSVHEGVKNENRMHSCHVCLSSDQKFTISELRNHLANKHFINVKQVKQQKSCEKSKNQKVFKIDSSTEEGFLNNKNFNYIKKRKKINFTMSDLEADVKKENDQENGFP